MLNILFAAPTNSWSSYQPRLEKAFEAVRLQVDLRTSFEPSEVDYIIYAPNSELQDFSPYRRCKAVLNLWAGVEQVVKNPTLSIPLARMVDEDGLTQGMVEWVCAHVLRHHLGIDRHIKNDSASWEPHVPPIAQDRRVGVLGFGTLGAACGTALAGLGFDTAGWSSTPKTHPKVKTYHGSKQLDQILSHSEILVLLLPLTDDTRNLLNASTLAQLPKGAVILNAARGPLIDDDALIEALDKGQVHHATLDVFATEPLPAGHVYWRHPQVTVTPHVASATRPASAAHVIAKNIAGYETGAPLRHKVDPHLGY